MRNRQERKRSAEQAQKEIDNLTRQIETTVYSITNKINFLIEHQDKLQGPLKIEIDYDFITRTIINIVVPATIRLRGLIQYALTPQLESLQEVVSQAVILLDVAQISRKNKSYRNVSSFLGLVEITLEKKNTRE